MKQFIYRWIFYVAGLLILAMGIILNTKSGLGVSPIISVPYTVSQIWQLNFGDMTMLAYFFLAFVEYLLKWKKFRPYDLLQLPLSVAFSRVLNLFAAYLPDITALWGRILCLIFAVVLTGIGAAMSVDMRLVPNPGDGIVQAISDRIKKELGLCKNFFDIFCVCTTAVLGYVMTGHLVGLGIGTLAAMIGVGRVIAVFNRIFKSKMCALSGLEE